MGLVEFLDKHRSIISSRIAEFFGGQRTHTGRNRSTGTSRVAATTPFETQPRRNTTAAGESRRAAATTPGAGEILQCRTDGLEIGHLRCFLDDQAHSEVVSEPRDDSFFVPTVLIDHLLGFIAGHMQRVGLVERIRLRRIARLESDDRPVFERQFDGGDRRRTGRILRILRSTRTCESGTSKSRSFESCAGEARFGLALAAERIRSQ